MDIKVGEYVRINNDNRNCIGVGKVTKIFNDVIYLDMNNKYDLPVSFKIENIIKHSKNIKDLIEVGDIVNGYLINETTWGILVHKAHGIDRSGFSIPVAQYNEDIKTILTKEQYNANCYKVKGE